MSNYFAFEFKVNNEGKTFKKLIISPYSMEEFNKILNTNKDFALKFSKWFNFRIILEDELENNEEFITYKSKLIKEINNSTDHLIAKLVSLVV
jgi:protein associated with RNAse G/E